MKTRLLLCILPLAALLAACGTEMPTATDAPERAAFDGGSFGPGHNTAAGSTSTAPGGFIGSGHDTTHEDLSTAPGGSYGSGHDTASDSLTAVGRGGSLGPGH